MSYVMVPVPEEHVEDVMRLIIRTRERAALEDWDAEAISRFYDGIDEESRHLLCFVARAVIAGEEITEREASAAIELTTRETMGILRELNERARDLEHPNLLALRMVTEVLPNGRTQDKRILTIEPELAAIVREVERSDLLSESEPSEGSAAAP